MEISRFFNKVLLEDRQTYAIFNSLIMDVIFVNQNELQDIINFRHKDVKTLLEKGIYVINEEIDSIVLNSMREQYMKESGKIKILYLCISGLCNFNCKYCYVDSIKDDYYREKNMSFVIAKKIIDEWIKYIKEEKIKDRTILFYGGEPLLNFSLIKKIVNYIKSKRIKVRYEIVTNGSLINEEIADFFYKNDFVVGISIDGPKKINDQNRILRSNSIGSYETVINKIDILKEKKCNFGLSITLSESVLNNYDDVISWLKDIKPRGISYNLLQFTDKSNTWKRYSQKATEYLINSYNKLDTINIKEDTIHRKIYSYYNRCFKYSNCAAVGFNQLTIESNGFICVCQGCSKIKKHIIGDVNDFSFKQINNKTITKWVNLAPIMRKKCLKCPSLFICGGGCPIEAMQLFGNMKHLDEPFCIHTKKMLKWLLNKSYIEMIGSEVYEEIKRHNKSIPKG